MMENWFQVLPLEGLVNFKTGKLNSNAAKPDGMFPFFTCSQETFRTDTWSFDGEYVLLAGNNAAGIYPLKYFNGKFDAYQRTYAINAIDENVLVTRYVYYALRLQLELMKSISTGVATKFLTLSLLNRTQIPIPPLATQKKITSILSAYDDLIENNLRRIKILEEMAQNLYREWFVKFRFPGYQHARFTDSPLGQIPEGWAVKSVGEVALNFDRFRKPLSSIQRSERKGIYPYYGAAKIFDYIDAYIFDGIYLLVAEDGSVVTPDRKPVLQYVSGKFWPNNHTHILQGKGSVSTEFLYIVLSGVDITGYITGAAQPKITQANLNRIPVVVAEDSILQIFNEFIRDVFRQRIVLGEKNEALRRTRDLLLPRLISGEVDVSELDISVPEKVVL